MRIKLLIILLLSIKCTSREPTQQSNNIEVSIQKDTAEIVQVQKTRQPQLKLDSSKITRIQFAEIEVGLYDVEFWNSEEEFMSINKDTSYIQPDLGSTVQGKFVLANSPEFRSIKIEQQFETSLTIMNEGPHLDLLNWKHYTSDWIELKKIEENTYRSIKYSDSEYSNFPDFTEDELYDYINSIGHPKWAELIKNPLFPDGTHYSPGISTIRFRITGTNEKGEQIRKYIECEIAMGC
jgi:hypothetical protein